MSSQTVILSLTWVYRGHQAGLCSSVHALDYHIDNVMIDKHALSDGSERNALFTYPLVLFGSRAWVGI